MIERNLRYVTLRKHGSAFLDAFGFFPLDYFGAVGDNSTDNYANIQVAIDESKKRGYRYLFVPNGTYYYQGNLIGKDDIMFVGDAAHAKVYDGTNEIPIYQIGTQVPYIVGEDTSSFTAEEDGYIDISLPIQNAVEAILVLSGDVLYVTNGLVTVNGAIDDDYYLAQDVKLDKIELIKNTIRIHYKLEASPVLIELSIEWRVR